MHAEQRLRDAGLALRSLADDYALDTSGARFVSHVAVGDLLFLSGTVPELDGEPHLQGVLGADLGIEQGYAAARLAALSSLNAMAFALGDLDRVRQVVQLVGYVNSAPGFCDQPRVVNGATDLLRTVFGAGGLGTRAAIGCAGLAYGSSVEVVLTVRFDGGDVREALQTLGAASEGV
jgi:enamine deaminase RidA (YjgF/YER057c/UK114 family)